MRRTHPPGSNLTEAMVIIAVVAILLATSTPFLRGASRTTNTVVLARLGNVLEAELTYFSRYGRFTADRSALLAIDSRLPLGETETDPIFIDLSLSPVAPALCLFMEAGSGDWRTLYYSGATGTTVELRSPNECARRMIEEHRDPHLFDRYRTPAGRQGTPSNSSGQPEAGN